MYSSQNRSQADMDEMAAQVTKRFKPQIDEGRVEIMRDFSVSALSTFGDSKLDWAYLDGDHTYEGVTADLNAAYRVVRKNGLIGGDDYGLGSWYKDGVVRAVHDFLSQQASKLTVAFIIDGQFMLRKIE